MWRTGQRLPTKTMQNDHNQSGSWLEGLMTSCPAAELTAAASRTPTTSDAAKPSLSAPVGLGAGAAAGRESTISNAASCAERCVRGPEAASAAASFATTGEDDARGALDSSLNAHHSTP